MTLQRADKLSRLDVPYLMKEKKKEKESRKGRKNAKKQYLMSDTRI